ncbi:MAG: hypothetical protein AAB221_06595 [Bacteroidota bacterium]
MDYKIFSLEHTILNLLFTIPKFEVISSGNEVDGFDPLYKQSVSSSFLHFGTLVDILNSPDKYSGSQPKISQLRVKKHEIKDEKYSFKDVSIAIEVLSAIGHVKDDYGNMQRIIRLTESGAIALFTKTYLKEKQREVRDEQLHNSTVDTNKWMRIFTGVLVGSAVATLIVQGLQCNISRKQLDLSKSELSQQQELYSKCSLNDTATLDMGHPSSINHVILSSSDATKTIVDTPKAPVKPKSADKP